jgi:two-component system, OmpR family, sensor kinase
VISARIHGLSLRARVLLIAILLLIVGLIPGNVLVTGLLRQYLIARVDDQLHFIASRLFQEPGFAGQEPRRVLSGGKLWENYVAYLDPDGTLVGEMRPSDRPDLSDPVLPPLDLAGVAAHAYRPFDVPGEDGSDHWRVIALPVIRDRDLVPVGGTIVVAASLNEVRATIHRLQVLSLATAAGMLTVLTVLGSFAIRGGLRPLRQIEETLAGVAKGDLSQRVPDLASPTTEIGRLSAALNSMLSQNEAAFAAKAQSEARMRRFVADASHELRTPLVGIKGFTKLYRMGGLTDPADIDRTMGRIEDESERLTRLVEDLLLLARVDEHRDDGMSPQLAPMDLRTLAADALHDVRALDPSRPVELTGPDGGPPAAALALADEAQMRQVVSNLVGNAVAHTPEGSPIRIGVGTHDGHALVEIADSGPGLTEEQAQRVFDRFYRADGSRSRTGGGGAGLGLAIVKSLVSAHGGEIALNTAPGEGATFRVLLPLADEPVPDISR